MRRRNNNSSNANSIFRVESSYIEHDEPLTPIPLSRPPEALQHIQNGNDVTINNDNLFVSPRSVDHISQQTFLNPTSVRKEGVGKSAATASKYEVNNNAPSSLTELAANLNTHHGRLVSLDTAANNSYHSRVLSTSSADGGRGHIRRMSSSLAGHRTASRVFGEKGSFFRRGSIGGTATPLHPHRSTDSIGAASPKLLRRQSSGMVGGSTVVAEETMIEPLPYDSRFLQQTLPACFPYLRAPCLSAMLFTAALICIGLGIAVLYGSDASLEISIPYSHVNRYKYPIDQQAIRAAVAANASMQLQWLKQHELDSLIYYQGQRAEIPFEVPRTMSAPVRIVVELEPFYQNLFKISESRSPAQLRGDPVDSKPLKCDRFRGPGMNHRDSDAIATEEAITLTVDGKQRTLGSFIYNPCGLQPWNLFNDTFQLYKQTTNASNDNSAQLMCDTSDFGPQGQRLTLTAAQNPCEKEGLPWPSYKNRFKEPAMADHSWTNKRYKRFTTTSDPFLLNGWYYREAGHEIPDPLDFDLMVWTRVAPLSTTKKLLRIITTDLPKGSYSLVANEFFDTESFNGEKRVVLQSYSWIGGRNHSLGIFLLVFGSLAAVLGIAVVIQGLCSFFIQRRQVQGAGSASHSFSGGGTRSSSVSAP